MSIASNTPTTTSGVDVSGFEQMLEDGEFSIPCESIYWHTTGDEAAAWAIWFANDCPCPVVVRFNCDSCYQKKMANASPTVFCSRCKANFPGPVRRSILRAERIK